MTDTIDAVTVIAEYRAGLKAILDDLPEESIGTVIRALERAYKEGQQVFLIGNGGSAATASHMACDLAKTVLGLDRERSTKRFKVIALTDNMPLITAYSNDLGYETIFAESLRNLANEGDILVAITGSGNSPNIIAAVDTARELGLVSVGLVGFDGGRAREMLDHVVLIASDDYGYIEDAHMILVHLITNYFRRLLAGERAPRTISAGAPR